MLYTFCRDLTFLFKEFVLSILYQSLYYLLYDLEVFFPKQRNFTIAYEQLLKI